ncbi:MAG: DUF695 domain-containing protein [Pseudomonas sp.]|uniref:DUF695 domain-containing protein n=1 Tax=Pseudomonas sp. TaxID=306 RepID=UPI003390E84F
MTQDWDFYFLNVNDRPASIFLDLGIYDAPPRDALPHMAYVRVRLNAPREDGLSSEQEYDALVAIEDALEAQVTDVHSGYVGRCTGNGCRDFFFYVAHPQEWTARVATCMASFKQYRYEVETREDRDWSTYFSFLYPETADLQIINNRRVCRALEQQGDALTQPREIDHWTYFANADHLRAFIAEAQAMGFSLRAQHADEEDDDEDQHCAQLWRADIPAEGGIDEVTLLLSDLALKHGGEYDGWESQVVN